MAEALESFRSAGLRKQGQLEGARQAVDPSAGRAFLEPCKGGADRLCLVGEVFSDTRQQKLMAALLAGNAQRIQHEDVRCSFPDREHLGIAQKPRKR